MAAAGRPGRRRARDGGGGAAGEGEGSGRQRRAGGGGALRTGRRRWRPVARGRGEERRKLGIERRELDRARACIGGTTYRWRTGSLVRQWYFTYHWRTTLTVRPATSVDK